MINFTKEECTQIISLSNTLPKNRRDESPRPISYDFYSIGFNSETDWIFKRMDEYLSSIIEVDVIKNLDAIHLFNYSKGDRFVRHRDIYYENQIYNVGVCLNDDYQGGDFILYEPEYKVLPKQIGEIYTFKHSYEHEVLEVVEGNRWSLIGFYFYDNLNLKKPLL
jgi:hypothetical protein